MKNVEKCLHAITERFIINVCVNCISIINLSDLSEMYNSFLRTCGYK